MRYHGSILEAVGRTPLVRLRGADGTEALLLAKLENLNPGGSVKDRIGLAMVEDAEIRGLLEPGGTIIEPTSGNTGVGLAMVAALKGYRCVFTIPDKMSQEKVNLLRAFGARVHVCPTAVPPDSPKSYYRVAERLHAETPNSFVPDQYSNPQNPQAHYETTGPEIWADTEGKVTHFVCGMGTGGTISGAGRYLKEQNPDVRVIGVDPVGSILAEYFRSRERGEPQTYKVEGIGEDIVPETTDFAVIDDVITVDDRTSFAYARRLAREEGILVGGSSGSALAAAFEVARDAAPDDVIVVLFPDTGERYLSKVHSEEWLRQHGFLEEPPPLVDILAAKEPGLPDLVQVEASDPVGRAVDLMRTHTVSQLPVLKDGSPVGSLREDVLLTRLLQDPKLREEPVERVMEDPFPEVDLRADLEEVSSLLRRGSSAVLVREKGALRGIVTRIDLVEYLARRASP